MFICTLHRLPGVSILVGQSETFSDSLARLAIFLKDIVDITYIAGTVDVIEMGFGQKSPKIGRTLLSFRGVHLLEEWAALTSESPHRRTEGEDVEGDQHIRSCFSEYRSSLRPIRTGL